jgi:hypothetical protein
VTSSEILVHVREIQQLELSKIIYKIVAFVSSAIIVPILLWVCFGTYNSIVEIKEILHEVKSDMRATKVAYDKDRAYSNADLDAAKAQVKELNVKLSGLQSTLEEIRAQLGKKQEVKVIHVNGKVAGNVRRR